MIRFIIAIVSYYIAIYVLKSYVQPIRVDGPKHHNVKENTPTMGGLVILTGALIQFTVLGCFWHPITWTLMGFGFIGLYDDVQKVMNKDTYKGIAPKFKFLLQWVLAFWVLWMIPLDTQVSFFGYVLDLGHWYIIFASFIIVATSNAYNLTDGLDGLAATQGLILLFGFGVLAIAKNDLMLVEMITAMWIMLFGFYCVNYHPAKLFMGDVGSLPLGAVLGLLSVLLKVELAFALAASVLVGETVSVILQVFFFKMGYGRIFKMAPFHHHLELSGWHETWIVRLASVLTIFMLYLGSYAI